MDKAVSAAEAKRRFSRILREVRDGRSYVVTSHGRPVARIVPAHNGKKFLFIEDSLVEAKMGMSMRPGADSNTSTFGNHKIPIRNSLFNIICVADDRVDGSCGPGRSASSLFKWSSAAADVTVEMTDSIVRYEARPGGPGAPYDGFQVPIAT
jgi:prevent-host-death family protein